MLIPTRILTSRLRQWRTAHGFGVHSPFAYYFITRVLRERLPYYDFEQLPRLSGTMGRRHARMLYRLTVFFRPDSVFVSGPRAAEALAIVHLAHPSVAVAADPAEACMAIHTAGDDSRAASAVTILLDPHAEALTALQSSLPGGMTFAAKHTAVAVIRKGLPRQDFRLRF